MFILTDSRRSLKERHEAGKAGFAPLIVASFVTVCYNIWLLGVKPACAV